MADPLLQLLERGLARIQQGHPEYQDAVVLHGGLLRETLVESRPPALALLALERQQVEAQLREGVPLLHQQPAAVDISHAADLFGRLANVAAGSPDAETRERVGQLMAAATRDRLDPEQLFGEALAQHRDHLWALALGAAVDPELLTSLALLAVGPQARAYALQLVGWLDGAEDGPPDSARWAQGYCPICGAWPLLAELRGVELRRYLRCSACGTGWPTGRLQCPYCGNDDHHRLRTLQPEGERRFSISVCQRCNGYLKSANAFDPLPPALLALDDLASLHLDLTAIERGHQRPADSGFRLDLAPAADAILVD